MKILVFGDSISAGAWDKEGGWVNRLQKFTNQITVESNFNRYDMVYNLSISGDKTDLLQSRFTNEVTPRLNEAKEVFGIIFAIGINDALYNNSQKKFWTPFEKFQRSLTDLFKSARGFSNHVISVGLTPADESRVDPIPWEPDCSYKNDFIKTYDTAVKQISLQESLKYVPLFDRFQHQDPTKLLEDGIHPNTLGHQLIYDTIKPVLENQGML